ncbi:MAG TPA: ATP-dependent DNA helicase [Armatimonadota bacterium]
MQLNEEQKSAVEYVAGPQVIVAGPGSGKTRVIISKIEHLVTNVGIDPSRILAITFSNKAAEEMADRLGEAFPYSSHEFNVHTFHALCWNIVQEFAADAGFRQGVRVLDQAAAWVMVRRHIEEFGLYHYLPNSDPFRHIFDLLGHISRAKDEGVSPEEYSAFACGKRAEYEAIRETLSSEESDGLCVEVEKREELARFYTRYQEIMKAENCIDFGDQIAMALELLTKRPDVRKQLQMRWDYILVDEFQDTNIAQIELLKLLTGSETKVCAVGDPDQSIYRFRGASFASFLRFDDTYPDRESFALTQNYRSVKNVLSTAARLIGKNEDRYQSEKPVWTGNESGEPVTVLKAPSFCAEAEGVADEIVSLLQGIPESERRFGDFAVLYRAHAHRDEFIKAFVRRNIPFKVISGAGFFKKEEIRDICALMMCVGGLEDGVFIHRFLALSDWGIPATDLKTLSCWVHAENLALSDALLRIDECTDLSDSSAARIREALEYISGLKEFAGEHSASEVCREIFDRTQVLKRYLNDDFIDSRRRAANLSKFLRKVQDFEEASEDKSVGAFAEYLNYLLESGSDEEEAEIDDTRDAVQLMTVHAAKGLEWPYVFVVSMSSARFPTSRKSESITFPDELVREAAPQGDFHVQEERRLAYVAFTRAQRRLYLSCVEKKGKKASVFINEVTGDDTGVVEKLLPEVSFDAEIEVASRMAIAERDTRRQVIRVLDSTADIEAIRPYADLLGAIRELARDPEKAGELRARLQANIDPSLRESVEGMLNQELMIASVKASITPEPLRLSYSRVSTYEDCPLGYKFSYELKIPGKPKPYFSFGSTVHAALCSFLEGVKAGSEPSLDQLKAVYCENWQSEGYVIPSQEEGYRREGEGALESFYRRYQSEKVVPLQLEWQFSLPVGRHTVIGFVDRIDPLGEGACSVVDYKTGKAKTQKDVDADMQLSVYALAVRECLGLKAEKLSLYFLKTDEIISTTRTDEQLAEVVERILSVADLIEARKFEPNPDPFKCGRCDYNAICPATEA